MRLPKPFEEHQKEGIVRTSRKDIERAKDLILQSERKMRSMKINLEKVGVNQDNASDFVEQSYDTIMLLLRAILCSQGYTTTGKGAHEAEISFMQVLGFSENEVMFADELRYLRNGMLYYGKPLDEEYAQKAIAFAKKITPKLKRVLRL